MVSFDEMNIKENIVYNSNTGAIIVTVTITVIIIMKASITILHLLAYTGEFIGFTELGEVNNQITAMTRKQDTNEVATHMLTFMARAVFGNSEDYNNHCR